MYGGQGADLFVFGYADAFETNHIVDFTDGVDMIRIKALGLTYADMRFTSGSDGVSAIVSYSNWYRAGLVRQACQRPQSG